MDARNTVGFRIMSVILFILSSSFLPAEEYSIAVAPFANLSGNPSYDYIGFQASEFLSSALAGVRGVHVIERANLEEILKEQRLQLSGVTSETGAAAVGELLNARQILVGSFTVRQAAGSARLTLSARIVDVEQGTVITAAMAEAPKADDPADALSDLVFRLLGGLPGLAVTIGVEAAVDTLLEQDAAASADYARALAAGFANDDAAASEYLRKTLAADTAYYRGYADVADAYLSAVGKIEGTSIYYRLMQGQIERNKTLMAQAEPLGLYRSTMKVVARRIEGLLRTEAVRMTVVRPEQIDLKDVSAVITLPQVTIELSPEARGAVYAVLGEQEMVTLAPEGFLRIAAPPAGSLLSPAALEGLFDLSFGMSAAVVVKFLGKDGTELYRLQGAPVEFLDVSAGNRTWGAAGGSLFTPAWAREGWTVTTEGTVQVQARQLRDLAAVRVEIDQPSISSRIGFPLGDERLWKSLVLHAYRSRYVKITADDDPCPQVKDLVVTDSFLRTGDASLGDVPVVKEEVTPLCGWADLWGVVYYGDEGAATVRGVWDGAIQGESRAVSGDLTASSVLYFRNPNRGNLLSGKTTFTAKTTDAERSLSVSVSSGSSWDAILGTLWKVDGGVVYAFTNGLQALSVEWGARIWGSAVRLSDSRVAVGVYDTAVWCFDGFIAAKVDRGTGKELLRKEIQARSMYGGNPTDYQEILAISDAVYATCYYDNGGATRLFRLDPDTLEVIWESANGRGELVSVAGNLYLRYETMLERIDPGTGEEIGRAPLGSAVFSAGAVFGTDGKKVYRYGADLETAVWSTAIPAKAVILRGNTLFATGIRTWALSAETGEILWEREKSGKYLAVYEHGVIVGDGSSLTALDIDTGYIRWTSPFSGRKMAMAGAYMIHEKGCIDLKAMHGDLR